ncbi:MAG: hypothetical protein R3304_05100 [Longimicrobiales bacterium]|nr:hypothetical protein [Longimicrobiales bacterium]
MRHFRNGVVGALLLLLVGSAGVAAQHQQGAPGEEGDGPPLYDDLGSYHYAITTDVPEAQAYFDQGLRLYYAFNHAEAIRSFRKAQSLDPGCAMCWWGEALALGPNINLPMDRESALAAHEAIREARARSDHVSARERDMIDALRTRYAASAPDDRGHLDRAYADALARLVERYPSDPEIRVLRAEAVMDLRPWDYWTEDGDPRPGMAGALEDLVRVQETDPSHPGACHFFIHAVEKLYPERAVPCAEHLAGMMPGAGHLVHMPGHIYIRVGRYRDAIEANRHAIHADETYIRDQRPGVGMYTAGYYPHNYDFLAFASMMIGRGQDAVEAASKVATLLPEELFGAPGMDFLQHWSVRPLLFQVRFGRWDEILDTPAPPSERAHSLALWHYASGRAEIARGRSSEAGRHLSEIRSILESGRLEGIHGEFNRSADLVAVGERVLAGHLAAARGDHEAAISALREGVRREDALLYGEPPEWSVPTRQDLGAVLLQAGRPAEAEVAFREDLDRFPGNGWSLHGLTVALRAQGKHAEAAVVEADLQAAWETADTPLPDLRQRDASSSTGRSPL